MKSRHYTVSFDTPLGEELTAYFKQCNVCNEAVSRFVAEAPTKFKFAPTSSDTYVINADQESGGLLAIVMPADADTSMIDRFMWAHVTTREGDVAWYPRVHKSPAWYPYSKASDIEPEVKPCLFKDVARLFTTDDIKRCTSLGYKQPLPEQSVACIFEYGFDNNGSDDDVILPDNFKQTAIFEECKQLCDAWQSLPVVRKGTLSRVLQLKLESDKPTKDEIRESANLSWSIDYEARLYHIQTGLVSASSDFKLSE